VSSTDEAVITYEEWGASFFRHAVSEERILGAIAGLAGEPIDFGPMKVGPGRLASVSAHGKVGQAITRRESDDPVRYRVQLPVSVDFALDLHVGTQRFSAELDVPLVLTARAVAPLTVVIEVQTPSSKEIDIDLKAEGLRASVVKEVADVKGELRRFVAKYVAREVAKPHIAEARTIDVLSLIDVAWKGARPSDA
jgi:hypothetical protein